MGKKVMIVDDEPDITLTVKQGLETLDEKYEVIRVESGEKCIEMLEKGEIPDLILLDIMMPEMTGWELLNRLRDRTEWEKIPVVFLTAKTDAFTKTFGKSVTKDFIEKPFDMTDLKERIDKILKKLSQKYPPME